MGHSSSIEFGALASPRARLLMVAKRYLVPTFVLAWVLVLLLTATPRTQQSGAGAAEETPEAEAAEEQRNPAADGCTHVYLDLGSNSGVQIRKLFEPDLYTNVIKTHGVPAILPVFERFFGNNRTRDACSFGWEPNSAHTDRLADLEVLRACMHGGFVVLHVGPSTQRRVLTGI